MKTSFAIDSMNIHNKSMRDFFIKHLTDTEVLNGSAWTLIFEARISLNNKITAHHKILIGQLSHGVLFYKSTFKLGH